MTFFFKFYCDFAKQYLQKFSPLSSFYNFIISTTLNNFIKNSKICLKILILYYCTVP